jgi:hypothetical protein
MPCSVVAVEPTVGGVTFRRVAKANVLGDTAFTIPGLEEHEPVDLPPLVGPAAFVRRLI